MPAVLNIKTYRVQPNHINISRPFSVHIFNTVRATYSSGITRIDRIIFDSVSTRDGGMAFVKTRWSGQTKVAYVSMSHRLVLI